MSWAGKGGSRAWRRVRLAVLNRDGHVCQVRGPRCTGLATHVDHMAPWFGRPEDVPINLLRAACRTCNIGQGAPTTEHLEPVRRTRW